jgi:hypothetical protein
LRVDALDRFDAFRWRVLADPVLQERLRPIPDWPSFAAAAVDEAGGLGLTLTVDDVRAAREAAARTWLERWI